MYYLDLGHGRVALGDDFVIAELQWHQNCTQPLQDEHPELLHASTRAECVPIWLGGKPVVYEVLGPAYKVETLLPIISCSV